MQDMVETRTELKNRRFHRHTELLSYPEKWDWREKSFVTDVRPYTQSTTFLLRTFECLPTILLFAYIK